MTSLSSFFGITPPITGPLLLHGDCLEKMKNLPSKSIDCFVCDLPYGCLSSSTKTERFRYYDGVRSDSILNTKLAGCSWDIKIDLPQFWEQVKRLAKNDNTPVIMFCSTKFGAELIASNPDWFRHDLVWSKSRGVGFLSANKQPLRSHEMIYVFAKKGAYYKRVDIEGDFPAYVGSHSAAKVYNLDKPEKEGYKKVDNGKRCVKSVVEVGNETNKGGKHPTQKPALLYKWLLERYCPPGGTMLDPTAGSFSSVFTARDMGLHGIGIEKDAGFFWKAVSKIV
jgi:site-specific DNA-methyltransferase (adenine-specific)